MKKFLTINFTFPWLFNCALSMIRNLQYPLQSFFFISILCSRFFLPLSNIDAISCLCPIMLLSPASVQYGRCFLPLSILSLLLPELSLFPTCPALSLFPALSCMYIRCYLLFLLLPLFHSLHCWRFVLSLVANFSCVYPPFLLVFKVSFLLYSTRNHIHVVYHDMLFGPYTAVYPCHHPPIKYWQWKRWDRKASENIAAVSSCMKYWLHSAENPLYFMPDTSKQRCRPEKNVGLGFQVGKNPSSYFFPRSYSQLFVSSNWKGWVSMYFIK